MQPTERAYAYLPNYFTRSLSQQCVPVSGANTCARDNHGQSDFGTPGCRLKSYEPVDAAQLALAQAALEAFVS